MNITEKAKAYAEGKALNAISKAIEEAYAIGYRDGYNDGLSSREDFSSNDLEGGVEYVDLGLPSGTKWAVDYLKNDEGRRDFYYNEVRKLNLPTPQQFKEFLEYTRWDTYTHSQTKKTIMFLGANGNRMSLPFLGSSIADLKDIRFVFWLKDLKEEGSERNAGRNSKIVNVFTGYKLPVLLVR